MDPGGCLRHKGHRSLHQAHCTGHIDIALLCRDAGASSRERSVARFDGQLPDTLSGITLLCPAATGRYINQTCLSGDRNLRMVVGTGEDSGLAVPQLCMGSERKRI